MNSDLFHEACRRYGVQPDRRGECNLTCPNCAAPVKDHQVHFSFSERGGYCFRCQYRCSLGSLLGMPRRDWKPEPKPAPPPRPPAYWRTNPEPLVSAYTQALDRVTAWQRYRPFSLDTINRFELGVGVLPATRCRHPRLIIPVRRGGQVVALYGRRMGCDCDAKGLVATTSQTVLFNGDALRPGADVIVVENRADSILVGQTWPEVTAVAIGSTSYWRHFIDEIAASQPVRVMVWLDNDPTGCPNTETYVAHVREMAALGRDPVEPCGTRLVNGLRHKGVLAEPWPWPAGTPRKHDPALFFADLRREVA